MEGAHPLARLTVRIKGSRHIYAGANAGYSQYSNIVAMGFKGVAWRYRPHALFPRYPADCRRK